MEIDHENRASGEMPDGTPGLSWPERTFTSTRALGSRPAVFSVQLEAGARTRPHAHHRGQVLCIISGKGTPIARTAVGSWPATS